jgi:hypothetical protein
MLILWSVIIGKNIKADNGFEHTSHMEFNQHQYGWKLEFPKEF